MAAQAPVDKFRAGAVSGALWENEINVAGQQKTVLKVSVSKRYRDQNGEWKTSQSFSRDEIPLAIYCLGKAFQAMVEKHTAPADEEVGQERVI
jgi:hypothetical protein